MDTCSIDDWIMSYSGQGMLKSCSDCHTTFEFPRPVILAIYDPFNLVTVSCQSLIQLKNCGLDIPYRPNGIALFDEPEVACAVLQSILTPNLYVFAKEGYETNAIALIKENEVDEALEILKKFNLCGVAYSSWPMEGSDLVQLNYDDEKIRTTPNHLTKVSIWDQHQMNSTISKLPKMQKWYAKMTRYKLLFKYTSFPKYLKQYLRWSWMKFLLPLAVNEYSTNIPLLLKNIYNYLDKALHVKISLRLLLNGLKMHINQLTGVTNIVAYNHKLYGSEIPFGNFLYFIDASMFQWLHPKDDQSWKQILLDCYKFENDWIMNDLQRMLMRVYMYAEEQYLTTCQFPKNIESIFKLNKRHIIRRRVFDPGTENTRLKYLDQVLNILNLIN